MKLSVVSSSSDGWIDQSISDAILKHLAIGSEHESEAVIVPVSYRENYQFNQRLNEITKRVFLIDIAEYGWESGTKPNLLGTGVIRSFGHLDSDQWGQLDQWAAGANIIAHFKRELMRKDASSVLLPVEYLCRQPIPPRQSREEFNKRPLEVFSSWGLSNPVRQVLHGDIFRNAHTSGLHVVDAWDQDERFNGKTWDSKWPVDGKVWATIHCPHYNRKPMEQVMHWQRRAKLSVSLPGSGVKCFRSAEAPVGSIMALQEDDLAWAYDWIHGENCIRLTRGKEFESLLDATRRDDLYDIYCASQDSIAQYQPRQYVADYLIPAIASSLSGHPAPKRRKVPRSAPISNQFLHRGDLGDILACLPSIRASGGGELLIAPHTPGSRAEGRQDLRGARFEAIKPLLEIQPYVHAVRWVEQPPECAIDFSTFRKNTIQGQSLSLHQARHIGVAISEEPWLQNVKPRAGLGGRIIVTRTARYHNWQFPWPDIVREHRERILFVGMPEEHKEFCKLVGPVEYMPTANLLEVAQVIAGSDLFIGNQTAAMWIALGLGHPLIQETWQTSPDCRLPRANAQYCPHGAMPVISAPVKKSLTGLPKLGTPNSTVTVCFSICQNDREQAQSLARFIHETGGVSGHQCLLVYPEGVSSEGIEEPLREAFGSLETHSYPARLSGWPQGPNEAFAEAAMLIARDARFGDFLWLEPDCLPVGPKWLDTIFSEYRVCGKPMLGVTTDTVALDTGHRPGGRHTVGVAVYPKMFAKLCPLVRSVVAMSEGHVKQKLIPAAFDVYFGAYTAGGPSPNTADTRLIQHLWRSSNFRREGDALVGDVPHVSIKTVNPEAVLLHGCKDSSLLNLLRASQNLSTVSSRGGLEVVPADSHKVADAGSSPAPDTNSIAQVDPTDRKLEGALLNKIDETLRPKKKGKHEPVPREQWHVGEDGLPVPPFMLGQPEFRRQCELSAERWGKGYDKVRKYAAVNLKMRFKGRMKWEKLVELIVLKEREMGKEAWTKNLKPLAVAATPQSETASRSSDHVIEAAAAIPPPQVNPMPQWGETKPSESGISDAMRAKMIQMRKERGMVTA